MNFMRDPSYPTYISVKGMSLKHPSISLNESIEITLTDIGPY